MQKFVLPEDSLADFFEQYDREVLSRDVASQDENSDKIANLNLALDKLQAQISWYENVVTNLNAEVKELRSELKGNIELPRQPFMYFAGMPGSGKSFAINSMLTSMHEKLLTSFFEERFDPEFNEELVIRWAKNVLMKNNHLQGWATEVLNKIVDVLGTSSYSMMKDHELAGHIRGRLLAGSVEHEHRFQNVHRILIVHSGARDYVPVSKLTDIGFTLTKCTVAPGIPWADAGLSADFSWFQDHVDVPTLMSRSQDSVRKSLDKTSKK